MDVQKSMGYPLNYYDNTKGYVENFMKLMFEIPTGHIKRVQLSLLNKLFILHADHEQNCSTSTVRMVGSSHAGLFASISSGVSALWGPLHGGANQAVLEMLEEIHQNGGDADKYGKSQR
jgi:citrate synthase